MNMVGLFCTFGYPFLYGNKRKKIRIFSKYIYFTVMHGIQQHPIAYIHPIAI